MVNIEPEYKFVTDLLNRMTSFIKRDIWKDTRVNVGSYVFVEKPNNQRNMFSPDPKYFIEGYITYQLKG